MAYALSQPIRIRNYDISKLTQWHIDVSRANGGELPPLPKIDLEDLPRDRQIHIQEVLTEKKWRVCSICCRTDRPTKACAGCGYANGRWVYYCSEECQRQNWPIHREFCGDVYKAEALLDKHIHLTRKFLKIWNHQLQALSVASIGALLVTKDWAVRQTLLMNPSINYRKTILVVSCKSVKAGLDYILPHTLTLMHLSDAMKQGYICTDMLNQNMAFVRFFVDDNWLEHHYIDFRLVPRRFPDMNHDKWTRHCYWPWVFTSMVTMGRTHSEVAVEQWLVLMDPLDPLCNRELPNNPLKGFLALKKLKIGESWKIYDFDRWQSIVGGVVAF